MQMIDMIVQKLQPQSNNPKENINEHAKFDLIGHSYGGYLSFIY